MTLDAALLWIAGISGALWLTLYSIGRIHWRRLDDQTHAENLALIAWTLAIVVVLAVALFGDA